MTRPGAGCYRFSFAWFEPRLSRAPIKGQPRLTHLDFRPSPIEGSCGLRSNHSLRQRTLVVQLRQGTAYRWDFCVSYEATRVASIAESLDTVNDVHSMVTPSTRTAGSGQRCCSAGQPAMRHLVGMLVATSQDAPAVPSATRSEKQTGEYSTIQVLRDGKRTMKLLHARAEPIFKVPHGADDTIIIDPPLLPPHVR